MNLFSYVITHDYGFAPNPFGGFLTLATCKPKIRKTANPGDWIMGTGSVKNVGINKLIYAAKINQVIPIALYGLEESYLIKRPTLNGQSWQRRGDNIYYKNSSSEWSQRENPFHGIGDQQRDLSGKNVLICNEFWYFGNVCPEIPDEFGILIKRGPNHKKNTDLETINKFIQWLSEFECGLIGRPSGLSA